MSAGTVCYTACCQEVNKPSLSAKRMSQTGHHLRPDAGWQERLSRWLMLGTITFFLFAATIVPSSRDEPDPEIHSSRINGSVHVKDRRHHEATRESLFNEIYRRTFTRLKDEKQQFLSAEQAKFMLPGNAESRRKVHCGGWVSDIPSIVLKFMGRRCPPMDLI